MFYQKPPALCKSKNSLQSTNEDHEEKNHGQPANEVNEEEERIPIFVVLRAVLPKKNNFIFVEVKEDPGQQQRYLWSVKCISATLKREEDSVLVFSPQWHFQLFLEVNRTQANIITTCGW